MISGLDRSSLNPFSLDNYSFKSATQHFYFGTLINAGNDVCRQRQQDKK